MSTKLTNDGGPAFPGFQFTEGYGPWRKPGGISSGEPAEYHAPGLTLRDYFAAKALTGQLASVAEINRHLPSSTDLAEFMATMAYRYADAMLNAREQ